MAKTRDPTDKISIGFLLFPRLTQLDLMGPVQVFSSLPGAEIHLIWKTVTAIPTDARAVTLMPTVSFDDCPKLDILCVPGGAGQNDLMDDEESLEFLRRVAADCDYVTSVCTGSLVLGAAGLLQGYRAATHWAAMDLLEPLGAIPTADRVVIDRNRVTGGGVTAGIDFALGLVAELYGRPVAEAIQLRLEYTPAPPFDAGSPETAPPEIVEELRRRFDAFMPDRREKAVAAARRFKGAS